jgi:hypothetical protein
MTEVEGWSDSLGRLISWVDNAGDVCHLYNASGAPFLESKVVNIAMACALGGDLLIDDVKDCLVIFIHDGSSFLREPEVIQDGSEVSDYLGHGDCSD